MRESFVFHDKYLRDVPDELFDTFAGYVARYGLYGKEPEFEDWRERKIWNDIKDRIDADTESYVTVTLKKKLAFAVSHFKAGKANQAEIMLLKEQGFNFSTCDFSAVPAESMDIKNDEKQTSENFMDIKNIKQPFYEHKKHKISDSADFMNIKNNEKQTSEDFMDIKNNEKQTSEDFMNIKNNEKQTSENFMDIKNNQKQTSENFMKGENNTDTNTRRVSVSEFLPVPESVVVVESLGKTTATAEHKKKKKDTPDGEVSADGEEKPDIGDISAFIDEKDLNVNADDFWAYYSGSPGKDWRRMLVSWSRRERNPNARNIDNSAKWNFSRKEG